VRSLPCVRHHVMKPRVAMQAFVSARLPTQIFFEKYSVGIGAVCTKVFLPKRPKRVVARACGRAGGDGGARGESAGAGRRPRAG